MNKRMKASNNGESRFMNDSPQSLHACAELGTHGICLGYGSNTKWKVGYNLPQSPPLWPDLHPKGQHHYNIILKSACSTKYRDNFKRKLSSPRTLFFLAWFSVDNFLTWWRELKSKQSMGVLLRCEGTDQSSKQLEFQGDRATERSEPCRKEFSKNLRGTQEDQNAHGQGETTQSLAQRDC